MMGVMAKDTSAIFAGLARATRLHEKNLITKVIRFHTEVLDPILQSRIPCREVQRLVHDVTL